MSAIAHDARRSAQWKFSRLLKLNNDAAVVIGKPVLNLLCSTT